MESKKYLFVFTTIGYNGSLMYWHKVLENIFSTNPNSTLITLSKINNNIAINIETVYSKRFVIKKSKESYDKHFIIYNPFHLARRIWDKWDSVVINESTVFSLLAMMLCKVFRKRTILLVESSHINYLRPKLNLFEAWLRKIIYFSADSIITNNLAGANYIETVIKKNNKTVVTPYLTSELPEPNRSFNPFSDFSDQKNIIIVGQLVERKGVKYLFEHIRKYLETSIRVNFHFIGHGDLYDFYVDYKEKHKLTPVILHGKVDYEVLKNYYLHADGIILATLLDYRSLVPFEAINCNLPILHSIYDGSYKEAKSFSIPFDPKKYESFEDSLNLLLVKEKSSKAPTLYSTKTIIENWKTVLNKRI